MEQHEDRLAREVAWVRESLGPLPSPVPRPALVMVAGLPGTGKSYCSRLLSRAIPAALVQSDAVRQTLFPRPTYSPGESYWVFSAAHALLRALLQEGVSVIFDATNLQERNREQVYDIAEQTGARLIIVWVEAPEELVFERMERRAAGADRADRSEADWTVYQQMLSKVEPIRRPHFVVDTSRDVEPVLEKIAREARR